jgi:hypothetical protein
MTLVSLAVIAFIFNANLMEPNASITAIQYFLEHSCKVKINPITGLEGSRRLRLPDFNTFAASYLNTQG